LEFLAAIQTDVSCEIQKDKQRPELPAGNVNETDTQREPAFEPPEYIAIKLFVKASNEPE
jgi:hypothetical protein